MARSKSVPPGLDKLPCASGVPRLTVGKGKANLFLDGNPVVFTNAIVRTEGEPQTGDTVVLSDWKNSAIGWGVYNSTSLFKLRVLQLDREVRSHPECAMDVLATVRLRVRAAVNLRAAVGLPSEQTNVYRLVNSEGDRLSGLIVDVLNDVLVVISSALWVEQHRAGITAALLDITGAPHMVWRTDAAMMAQESGQRKPGGGAANIPLPAPPPPRPEEQSVPESVTVTEEGVQYVTDPLGQKTGFYADQRENRVHLRQLVKGKRVLDLCCYSGGFAINAALHGAAEVTGVDSSKGAIELATQNADLNGVSDRCSFECAKIESFLEDCIDDEAPRWDVVILDPPKLAPNKAALERASNKYTTLNMLAMQVLQDGGLLMTCSCSGAVAQGQPGTFVRIVAGAARRLRRPVTVLREASSGVDHAQHPQFPQGKYLSNVLVRVNEP